MFQTNLYAAVVSASFRACIRLQRRLRSHSGRDKPRFGDVQFVDQRISHCESAAAGEGHVVGLPPKAVGVSFESNHRRRIIRERFGNLLQPGAILRINRIAVFIEENAPQLLLVVRILHRDTQVSWERLDDYIRGRLRMVDSLFAGIYGRICIR
jgi:hypothetical protein